MGSNARAHHYVPKCWLAGFTESGEKDGRFWQTDINTGNQWPSNPLNAGHQRDFYRISDSRKDPLLIEGKLAEIEGAIAPILQLLDKERRLPNEDELGSLIVFMAIQWIRVPAFRPFLFDFTNFYMRANLSDALRSEESWERTLLLAGIPADTEGSDYQKMRKFFQSGEFSLNVGNDWYLKEGFTAAITVIESLEKRHWGVAISDAGDFIASDNPVVMDGAPRQTMGFENAGVVIYPVSRHLVLYGTRIPVVIPPMTANDVARHNTFMMFTASSYVYSHRPDFGWLDTDGNYQTGRRLFSKSAFTRDSLKS